LYNFEQRLAIGAAVPSCIIQSIAMSMASQFFSKGDVKARPLTHVNRQ